MKSTLTAIFFFLILQTQAQGNRYSDSLDIDAIAKGLAQIAMQNTTLSRSEEATAKATEYSYEAQKTAWLDNFRASANLNEFNIGKTFGGAYPTGNALWPRYNFGVVLPFGIFTNQPKQTKVQYYRYQAEMENVKAAKQNIGLQTMTAYYDYVRTQRLYELQEEAVQDASFA